MKTKVVFLKEEDGDILAVFPEVLNDFSGNITCYAHVGQHSGASVEYCKTLQPAEDYEDLKEELESIGYDLEVLPEFPKMNLYVMKTKNIPWVKIYAKSRKSVFELMSRYEDVEVITWRGS